MMFYIVSWFKSVNAYSAASTITGTLIGFLTGIYIPIGNLPGAVQTAIRLFPPSHSAVLFRKIMMEQAEKITFAGAPQQALEGFRLQMGIAFKVGDTILSSHGSFLYVLLFMVLFFVLSLLKLQRRKYRAWQGIPVLKPAAVVRTKVEYKCRLRLSICRLRMRKYRFSPDRATVLYCVIPCIAPDYWTTLEDQRA